MSEGFVVGGGVDIEGNCGMAAVSEASRAIDYVDRIPEKERPTSTNSADDVQVGAVQVNSRAPHINRGFFRGVQSSTDRARRREERAALRRARSSNNLRTNASTHSYCGVLNDEERPAATRRLSNESTHSCVGHLNRVEVEESVEAASNGVREIRASSGGAFNGAVNNQRNIFQRLVNIPQDLGLVSATLVEDDDVIVAEVVEDELPPPDSDIERIVQRLELRNAKRVPVPLEVKNRFLRLCGEAGEAHRRRILGIESSHNDGPGDVNGNANAAGSSHSDIGANNNESPSKNSQDVTTSSCILREDIIQIRKSIRLEVENRSKLTRAADGIKAYFGFRCHCKLLLRVLNRAVDSIDNSGHARAKKRRSSLQPNCNSGDNQSEGGRRSSILTDSMSSVDTLQLGYEGANEEEREWFYYKDFAFYNLKVESNYPWMRSAGVFSILTTLAFYIFTPLLWCTILQDENICPSGGTYQGWLTSLYFASTTMSTVGYGDVTVIVGSGDSDYAYPENWKIFIAIIFMILSLIVSVVGFHAGLDSQFHLFRRRIDIFGKRVYEILRDANVVKGANDKDEEFISRMKWERFAPLVEICLTFLIVNFIGAFAMQISLLVGKEVDELGQKLSMTWMESFYWAVQTTTTIGYGDIPTPDNLRWFMLLYLAFSTYCVGSAIGKLGHLNKKLESMQKLYLWQRQEASYAMLADFSGRPGGSSNESDTMESSPEIDQFEFTIASLVLLGKITSEDVRPILKKFKELTGESSKITAANVSGPIKNDEELPEKLDESERLSVDYSDDGSPKPSGLGAIAVGKKIAKAFREEVLSSAVNELDESLKEEKITENFSKFRIPKNTYAIGIDDSKIQRKLLSKFFDFAGIPTENTTIVGDGYDEIMGFEDFVVSFMENHVDDFVFLIVDENLDVVDESSSHLTISGSLCVENIRKRLPSKLENRMFALIRSANDSSSDLAIYSSRAHGFLPKAPIKREKINETLAPLWQRRFPTRDFGETISLTSSFNNKSGDSDDIACTPYEIAQKLTHIDSLFENNMHVSNLQAIRDEMHELKGDLLTLSTKLPVTNIIGQINLILVAQCSTTLVDTWNSLKEHLNANIVCLQENFCVPQNTYAIAIDDSNIQRKLLAKFFDFMGIPSSQCKVMGDGAEEIKGFEDFVVNFMENHCSDYVFLIVDENLDVFNDSLYESISGSVCIENIRKRLPHELERRMLAIVRSANDSKSDIELYNERAHGFLPKAPIRKEKANEVIAPLWLRRFPPSEFGDSAGVFVKDDSLLTNSEDLACTPEDIAQKLEHIHSLFTKDDDSVDWHLIHDQLHELKGDLLTMNSGASMISVLGTINLMLLDHSHDHDSIKEKWNSLQHRIHETLNETQCEPQASEKYPHPGLLRWSFISKPVAPIKIKKESRSLERRRSLTGSFISACSESSDP